MQSHCDGVEVAVEAVVEVAVDVAVMVNTPELTAEPSVVRPFLCVKKSRYGPSSFWVEPFGHSPVNGTA